MSNNVYDVLAKGNLHEELEGLGGLYRVVGGLGLHAVVNAEEVSWADHTVTVPDGISLPRLRENGTVCDFDTLVCSPDGDVIDTHGKVIGDVIGEEMTISVFGLRPYRDNKRGLLDFVGGRYVDSNGNLFWRLNRNKFTGKKH